MADDGLTPAEEWRAIPGCDGYEASSLGRIRSVDRILSDGRAWAGRVINPRPDKHGYLRVSLSLGKKGQYRHAQVHRLIAETFLGSPPTDKHEAAHWDGIKDHNRPGNLRWATPKQNAEDRDRHGRTRGAHLGEDHHNSALTEDAVREMRGLRASGFPLSSLAARFGVSKSTASEAISRKTWRHVL